VPRDQLDHLFEQRPPAPRARAWRLKRNCSLTPRQSAVAYGSLCLVISAIAGVFAWRGFWLVLAFAGLDMMALGWGFLHYARHATDCEQIVLADGMLTVERRECSRVERTCLNPCWTRVRLPTRACPLIALSCAGKTIEVGDVVSDAIRRQVGEELRQALQSTAAGGPG
jgi:uncharacterized membrane protein